MVRLPFLTLPDPAQSQEGALDPLGLSTIGDHLADQILPGLRARMSRPRFLTALAVSAEVCDGLEEQMAADGITPAYQVFEWLVVEAFARASEPDAVRHTPGILKAIAARDAGETMSARTYLRTPGVFGFHGVYKPLARHLGIVDENLRLAEHGYELLKVWQEEQGLDGFLDSAVVDGTGRARRQWLRAAVEAGLKNGFSDRGARWQGWSLLAEHLAPGRAGRREAEYILARLRDPAVAPRREVFTLLGPISSDRVPEQVIVRQRLLPRAGEDCACRLRAICAYEDVCTTLEESFDWIRNLSTCAQARAIGPAEFVALPRAERLAADVPRAIRQASDALTDAPVLVQQQFAQLARSFDAVTTPASLFELVLDHHARTQSGKKPDGKRAWFERSDDAAFIRVPYRLTEPPDAGGAWNRPYRIATA